MCGIAGVWGSVSARRLRAMADSLRHRGPDDESYWTQPRCHIGFAHRRLAVIDPVGGRQPVTSEDGRVVAIANGEIYNYRELRDDLIARNHHFKTAGDTEVIVHLYEECGADLVDKLRGMFAIALWDDLTEELLLIRDRVGKKPLYFTESGGEFVFASEIKGVLAGLSAVPSIDQQAVSDFLGWGAVPAPATIYQGIRCVEPAQTLVVRDRRVATRRTYWRMEMLPKTRLSRVEAVEQVETKLRQAVRLRLRCDVPVGCFLSGGIDSGIITAMAAQEHSGRLVTITVGSHDKSLDERAPARLVSQQYETEHHEVVIQPDIVADLPKIVLAYDQPFGDSSAIPSYYVSRAAREHVKVVLNGDGGDELFAGYRRYVAAWLNGLMAGEDGPKVRACLRTLLRVLPAPRGYRSGYAFVHRLLRGMGMDPAERYLAWAVDGFDDAALRDLGRLDGVGVTNDRLDRAAPAVRLVRSIQNTLDRCGLVDRMLATDFVTGLPDDLLVKMDIATMAHGLEGRSPLLDHELIDTVSHFPEEFKLGGWQTKPLLRELARRYLPSRIQRAPKRGFEVPLVGWLRGELRETCRDVILERNGLLSEMFDRVALDRLLSGDHKLDPARWSRRVWLLLMLGMWDRQARSG